MDFNCFVLFSCFCPVPFSCFFPDFFHVPFHCFWKMCFLCCLLFPSCCHALSDVLPHFSNPRFPILRLMSAKHSCKSTGHSISGPLVQTGPQRGKRTGKRRKRTGPNTEGKATTKKTGKKWKTEQVKNREKNRTSSEQPQTTTEIWKNEKNRAFGVFYPFFLPVVYLFFSYVVPVLFLCFSCSFPVFSCCFCCSFLLFLGAAVSVRGVLGDPNL